MPLTTVPARNDHTTNRHPDRGAKLRSRGSKPTGSQTMSFTPQYSSEKQYPEGYAAMNERTMAQDSEHDAGWDDLNPCCKDLGLNLKEPL